MSDFEARRKLIAQAIEMAPHMAALGIRLESFDPARAIMRLPYSENLVAYKETGVLAGGAVFSLMDSVCGMAVLAALKSLRPVATLDLRLDYMKPAAAGSDLFGAADCMRVTRHVAFVRGVAYHEREDDPIAHATGTFALREGPETHDMPQ